jgi:hypothetical protein
VDAGVDIGRDGDGDGESDGDGAAGEAIAPAEAVGSERERTTLSTACRSGCTDETRVSCARYDGHEGSSGGAGTYDAMGSWRMAWVGTLERRIGGRDRNTRTSPAARAACASCTTRAIAAQAQCARARVQSSGSPLRRGAKTVGQKVFLSARDAGVSAALRGTGSW